MKFAEVETLRSSLKDHRVVDLRQKSPLCLEAVQLGQLKVVVSVEFDINIEKLEEKIIFSRELRFKVDNLFQL